MLENRIRGGIYGVAVGDALGATVEFMSQKEISEKYGRHREMIGGGWLSLAPGEFTDDTQMTLAVSEGIAAEPQNPVWEIGERFMKWYRSDPKDIGNTIRIALGNFERVGDWELAARQTREKLHGKAGGNGCLMRTLPVTFAYLNDQAKMSDMSRKICSMTHMDPEAEAACVFYNRYAARLITSQDREGSLQAVLEELKEYFNYPETRKLYQLLAGVPYADKKSLRASGYVVDTLISALAVFLKYSSFEDIVIEAVNLGDDADTVGAVAGGLAGTFFGFQSIPQRWVKALHGKGRLENAVRGLTSLCS